MSEAPPPVEPSPGRVPERWRRLRSRFYLGLLVAMMLAIVIAGWINLARISR